MIIAIARLNLRSQLFAATGKRKKKRGALFTGLIVFLIIYAIAAMLFMFGALFYGIRDAFFGAGLGWFYFSLAGLMVFALCFVTSVFMAQTQIFAAKDNELLLSMPIKPSAILYGRVASLLVFEYFFEALVVLPAFALWCAGGYANALGVLFFILCAAVLPMLSLAAAFIVGWAVALITSRMRAKNIFTIVLSLSFLGLYLYFYTNIYKYMQSLIENGAQIADAVARSVFPAYHFGAAIADGGAVSALIFLLCAIIPFVLVCAVLSRFFITIATANRGNKRIKYKEKPLSVSGVRAALMKKELRRFASLPMYIMNGSLGAVFALALAAVLAIKPGLITEPLERVLSFVRLSQVSAAIIALTMLAALNMISAPSISLEGRSLWIIKSMPMRPVDVLLSKALTHFAVCAVPTVIAGTVCAVRLGAANALELILLFFAPLSATMAVALFGVTLNLAFPRLDWLSELQPIKQGMSSMLTMLGSMSAVTAVALVYAFALRSVMELDVYIMLCAAFFTALSAGMFLYLRTAGCRKFEAIGG